jgi:hypothetical protein
MKRLFLLSLFEIHSVYWSAERRLQWDEAGTGETPLWSEMRPRRITDRPTERVRSERKSTVFSKSNLKRLFQWPHTWEGIFIICDNFYKTFSLLFFVYNLPMTLFVHPPYKLRAIVFVLFHLIVLLLFHPTAPLAYSKHVHKSYLLLDYTSGIQYKAPTYF